MIEIFIILVLTVVRIVLQLIM